MYSEKQYPIDIPTWDNGVWEHTTFTTTQEFIDFLLPLFKEPGTCAFDDVSANMFNEQAQLFKKNNYYCAAPFRSKDFMAYWDDQKEKCRMGVIFKSKGKTWYIPRDYYMWLNFLPIFDKEAGVYDFPHIWDIQYYMALYEALAELSNKHAAILKKRQMASSYFHCAKLANQYWFEEGAKLKMGSSLKDKINEKGSWKMVEEYSAFLNEHTAWYRPHNPSGVMNWEQKIEVTTNGRDIIKGLKSTFTGHTFDKDPTNGVGGPCRYFFHEEAGIAPKMGETYEYMRPALHSGMITTGMFIAAGSVGDLDQCEPLKEFILHPDENDFYAVESNMMDEKGTHGRHGLFLPEQWSMPPFIDEFGNSLVEEALAAIKEQRAIWKRDLTPDKYRLRISQKPMNIEEAFAFRKAAVFPLHVLGAQTQRIEDNTYGKEYLDIRYSAEGKPEFFPTKKQPIMEFPVSKKVDDKEGCLVIYERPVKNPEWNLYNGSIDPVSEGKTTTSDSLCSIYIWKNTVEVTKPDENGEMKTHIEQGKLVAAWCGRFDDIGKTHERLELIIQMYNAWTIIENNISLFIQHMIAKRLQKYLVPKDQILFLKELSANKAVFADYGWKNSGTLFKHHLISYAVESVREVIDTVENEDKTETNILGVERIPDPMLLKEMSQYHEGLNVDRLVTYAALVAFVKVQQANRGYAKRVEQEGDKNLQNSQNLFKLKSSPFRHMGHGSSSSSGMKKPRSAFKRLGRK